MSDILYHYTSLETFLKIIESGKIRLTDLAQSNDALEGKYILNRLVAEIQKSNIPASFHSVLVNVLEEHVSYTRALGFCMSEEADQLSQWRGYGDDGQGVCLGFNRYELESSVNNSLSQIGQIYHNEDATKLVMWNVGDQAVHIRVLNASQQNAVITHITVIDIISNDPFEYEVFNDPYVTDERFILFHKDIF